MGKFFGELILTNDKLPNLILFWKKGHQGSQVEKIVNIDGIFVQFWQIHI